MGYLYLIKSDTYYKIGIANDVESRLAQLQTGNPTELVIDSCYEFPNAQAVETVLHQAFGDVRKRGEWFLLNVSKREKFESICTLLGGQPYVPNAETVDEEDVQEAEDTQESFSGNKFDFHEMFSDGWQMQVQDSRARYWIWRRRTNGKDESMWGGTIKSLPYPDLETMRHVYRDTEKEGES